MTGARAVLMAAALVSVALAGEVVAAGDAAPLVRTVAGAEVDWSAGTITARGGAAADYLLPSAELARPAAERRARAAAVAQLGAALDALPLGGRRRLSAVERDAAVARAHAVLVDYQSNGGVVLTLLLRFEEIEGEQAASGESKPPTAALSVAAMPLELAPRLAVGAGEGALPWVVYRIGNPPAQIDAVALRRDREGRLALPRSERGVLEKLARRPAVIYVQKILK